MRLHFFEQATAVLRWHDAHDDGGSDERLCKIVAGLNAGRDGLAGQETLIDAALSNAVADFFFVGPEANAVSSLPSQNDGERSTPCTSSNNGNFAHARLAPLRFSVPASNRRMFS